MSRTTHSKAESVVTSTSLLEDAKALSEKVSTLLGPAAQLRSVDLRRSTKLRKGGEGVLPIIVALSSQQGLVVPSHPTKAMEEKMALAKSLVPLQRELVMVTKQVTDALFLAQSESWAGASVHYSMLRRLAKLNGTLAKALDPVTQFFASRSAAVKAEEKATRGGKGTTKSQASPPPDAEPSPKPSNAGSSQATPPADGAPATQ